MKLKLIATSLLAIATSTAMADTFFVTDAGGTAGDTPKLMMVHSTGASCLYADKNLNVGDTLVVGEAGTVLVCARAPHGAVFYQLDEAAAKRVTFTLPSTKPNAQATAGAYKISSPVAPDFTPVKAWNEGDTTFIALAKPYRGELPIVFAMAEDGGRQLVNFQWDEQNAMFVVPRVLERAILVLGDKSVVVTRL